MTSKKQIFTVDFLKEIKKLLQEKQARLEDDLSKFAKKDPNAPGGYSSKFPNYGDKNDENAAEVADYQVRLSMEENLEKALRDVKKALQSLEKDEYGICKYCQNPIEEKRLLIRPDSSACMSCKQAIKREN